uniref:TIL domain-containing protein n=1 Tax=Steinernema glaseri TaxID=37863 RepID=A0A1I7YUA6_9BILA
MKIAALALIALAVAARSETTVPGFEAGTTQQCGENEYWSACVKCEPTCWDRTFSCPETCTSGKCLCNLGHYRDRTGLCVTSDRCPVEAPHVADKSSADTSAAQP